MDISIYFSPVEITDAFSEHQLGSKIEKFDGVFPSDLSDAIVIFYLPEYRGSQWLHVSEGVKSNFRESFYSLNVGPNWNKKVIDLGNITPGGEYSDSHAALVDVFYNLIKMNSIPLLIGGSQDLVFSMYKSYERLEQFVNICSVDSKLDLGNPEDDLEEKGYLGKILFQRPCYLFNQSNIGLQIPYASAMEYDLFKKLCFDICRLGEYNNNFKHAEPHIRNADMVNIDFTSLKASEIDNPFGQPNGFYAEQMCQIAKYAGMSDKLSSMAIFNYSYFTDLADALLAQIMWYFIDGVESRVGDFPVGNKKEYAKFTVILENSEHHEIAFYKSNKSQRWWMEVPYPPKKGSKYERHLMVPCNKEDYDFATKNEVPDLWWKTYQKLL